MIIRACAFTDAGWAVVDELKTKLDNHIFVKRTADSNIDDWVKESFDMRAPLLFVGAMGIAVRKIAPYVDDKLTDSPVVVIDEMGENVISVLSGHLGGANELTREFSGVLCANAVITTATDVNNAFAVDVFARNNALEIVNRDGIRKVSSKILKDGKITMAVSPELGYDINNVPDYVTFVSYSQGMSADVIIDNDEDCLDAKCLLRLRSKPYVIGLGCRKDTDAKLLEQFLLQQIGQNNISIDEVAGIASIDLKSKEYAIAYLETKYRLPFVTYTAEELDAVEGEFNESPFVREKTGVGNVCERAAVKLAGNQAELIIPKIAHNGMTFALCRRKARIEVWET